MKKILLLLSLFLSFAVIVQAGEKKEEKISADQIKRAVSADKPLQAKLDVVYENVKDYDTPDFTIGSTEIRLGKMIKSRCMTLMCALMLLYFGIKVLPVMYSPDKELDANFWIKPILLTLFMSCYCPCMNFVDNVMSYLSFKDMTKEFMAVTNTLQQLNEINNADMYLSSAVEKNDEQQNLKSGTVTEQEVAEAERQFNKQTQLQEAINAVENGTATEEQKKLVDAQGQEAQNKSLGVRIFRAIVGWLSGMVATIARMYQTIMLCVLFVGGPIAIMLEILPPFKGTLPKWFGMYVHTQMWTPVFFIIDTVSTKLYTSSPSGFAGSLLGISFQIVMLVMYMYVGKLAGYFVKAQGADAGSIRGGVAKIGKGIKNAGSGLHGLVKGGAKG